MLSDAGIHSDGVQLLKVAVKVEYLNAIAVHPSVTEDRPFVAKALHHMLEMALEQPPIATGHVHIASCYIFELEYGPRYALQHTQIKLNCNSDHQQCDISPLGKPS